jgi:4-hydroxy-tetrahydrodipicolinate reductase
MRLALIGYGKMGREIERLALERLWTIGARLDIDTPKPEADTMRGMDAAIHFARAGTIVADLLPWARAAVQIVVGTTGWEAELPAVRSLINDSGIGLVAASNFSVGVNLFHRVVREASRAVNRLSDYDVFIHEVHHKDKLDSPSGTALDLGRTVMEELKRKTELLGRAPDGKILPHQLHVSSSRAGAVVGTHTVTFDSAADSIELKHTAKNRTGFALGALLAAEWVQGKKGMFTMADVIDDLLRSHKE